VPYDTLAPAVDRRTFVKSALAIGAATVASPYVVTARAADVVKLGMANPLTGTYAAFGKNESIGCQLAIEEINGKGGILGRQAQLLVEDSTSGDAGTAVQKSRKLIEGDHVDFLLGNVNSGLALAMAGVSSEKGVLQVTPGGHSDSLTGKSCHWNVFRVCNTTEMLANAVATALVKAYGKKYYYITPDYAYGHAVEAGLVAAIKKLGGERIGGDLSPLGAVDFSSYLIKAQSAQPDVILLLMAGDDLLNCLKQAVQFGLDKKVHLAGALMELEVLEGLPPDARIGSWVMEWYWKQPGVPHIDAFVEGVKKKTGRVPTARHWFGYVAGWTCALAAEKAKSLKALDMAKALQDFALPADLALGPNKTYYRAGQNQLLGTLYVGQAQAKGSGPDDLFNVMTLVNGAQAAGTLEESGCKLAWPT
jgi:branched-chain amino acid transport system substrate-binding protein